MILVLIALCANLLVKSTRIEMPSIGLGTAGLRGETQSVVVTALNYGVRLLDTAQATEWYDEYSVGQAVTQYEIEHLVPPEDIMVVTKIHPRSFEYSKMDEKLEQSRANFNRDSLDVVLLHTPYCWEGHCTAEELKVTWQTAWRNLEQLKNKHNIKAVGVSNFHAELLSELLLFANSKVAVVQNWMDPFHQDLETRLLATKHHIHYMAYSSFGTQWGGNRRFANYNPVLTTDDAHPENKVLRDLAAKYQVSVPIIIISWAIQLGTTIIPRSASPKHVEDNFRHLREANDDRSVGREQPIYLSVEDMEAIASMDGSIGTPWD